MDIYRKYPIPTAQEENVQQAMGVLWAQFEQGNNKKFNLETVLEDTVRPGILEELIRGNYVLEKAELLEMTPGGMGIARDIVRRHRLTERLLKDILELPGDQINPNACRMEHVITRDVEEAICILLGHPQACSHGFVIPKGACCERALEHTGPVVVALSSLLSGQEGRIAYFSPQNRPELHKLLSMGLVPGVLIRVDQTFPAFVVFLGETMLAMDSSLARQIFVRRRNGS